jgi:hypothetical protein
MDRLGSSSPADGLPRKLVQEVSNNGDRINFIYFSSELSTKSACPKGHIWGQADFGPARGLLKESQEGNPNQCREAAVLAGFSDVFYFKAFRSA